MTTKLVSNCIGKICMVRTENAGVFFGTVLAKKGTEVQMNEARRVWYWAGAATLSTLATTGTSDPTNCKFPCAVEYVELTQVIEVIIMTQRAIESLRGVTIWQK